MRVLQIIGAFPVAFAAAFAGVSLAHTQFVLAGLSGVGAAPSLAETVHTSIADLEGLFPSLGPVLAIALAIGFLVAAGLKRVLKPLAGVAYPIAGFAAMATALIAMRISFHSTPLAGARGPEGFVVICLMGALGGLVFSALLPKAKAA
jgi:hypothetical protein